MDIQIIKILTDANIGFGKRPFRTVVVHYGSIEQQYEKEVETDLISLFVKNEGKEYEIQFEVIQSQFREIK